MATGTELLAYDCQRGVVALYEAKGHRVVIRRNRHGSLRWRLDDRRTELCTRDAMERIDIALAPAPRKGS